MVIVSVLIIWNWVLLKFWLIINKICECRDEYIVIIFYYIRMNLGLLFGVLSYNKGLGFRVLGILIFDIKINF